MKRYIKLIITDENGRSETIARAPFVSALMIQVAKECSYTLLTDKRFERCDRCGTHRDTCTCSKKRKAVRK